MTPWDELAAAQDEALDALRSDDVERHRAALERVTAAREACGALGGMLILLALDHAGLAVQKKLSAVFGGLSISAYQKAQTAESRASWAVDELDALREQMRALEKRIANLTPGIGEPGRTKQIG